MHLKFEVVFKVVGFARVDSVLNGAFLLLDLSDTLVRGQGGQATHLDCDIYGQLYYEVAGQQPPYEAGFCVNTRRLWWIHPSNLILSIPKHVVRRDKGFI